MNDKKTDLPLEHKIEITLEITKMLLTNLLKSYSGLPKSKISMLKKIGAIVRMYGTREGIDVNYKQTLDQNKQVNLWVFQLLEAKNIIIWDKTDNKTIEINIDQMSEYLSYIERNIEICKQELSKMKFLNK